MHTQQDHSTITSEGSMWLPGKLLGKRSVQTSMNYIEGKPNYFVCDIDMGSIRINRLIFRILPILSTMKLNHISILPIDDHIIACSFILKNVYKHSQEKMHKNKQRKRKQLRNHCNIANSNTCCVVTIQNLSQPGAA